MTAKIPAFMKAMMIGSFAATLIAFQGVAQGGENDDMYFNAKDRQKLSASVSANDKIDSDYKAFKKKHFDEVEAIAETKNPTDSYSRNINPEYISRSNSEQASEDEQNYYVEGYTPNTFDSYSAGNYNNYTDNLNNSNLNYNNRYNASSWNSYSPYYGYCNPWRSPYYNGGSSMTISLSYVWSSGGAYYNPYSNYPSYYSPYSPNYGYGYPSYYYYGNSEPSRINYGKRPSRHSAIVNPAQRSSRNVTTNTNRSTNGRTRQTTDEYYVKPSRRVATFENTGSDRFKNNSTDYSRTRESYNTTRESRSTYSAPSRSSSSPSRSSSSGSSGSRSRGRD